MSKLSHWLNPSIPIGPQFVVWPLSERASWFPLFVFERFKGRALRHIYRWAFQIGPFEVRWWRPGIWVEAKGSQG